MNRKYSAGITKRFLTIMNEARAEGIIKTKTEFAESVGEHQQNISLMEKGTRTPTLEHIAEACLKYGYSANWVMLNKGDKKLTTKEKKEKSIEARLREITSEFNEVKTLLVKAKRVKKR